VFLSIPALVAAILGGAAISVQSLFSGTLGQKVGIMESSFIVHLVGLVLAGLVMLLMRGGNLGAWRSVPWYVLTAGLLGVGIVAAISFAVPRLGLAATVTLTVVSQLTIGAALDHFGWLAASPHPFGWSRAAGIVALFFGTWLIVR
jgi:transporter family-2 protein